MSMIVGISGFGNHQDSLYLLADEVNIGAVRNCQVCSIDTSLTPGVLETHSVGGGSQSVSNVITGISYQLLLDSI